jgi:hypothetical protein
LHSPQEFKDSGIWSRSVVEETKEKTTKQKTAKESDVASCSFFHLKASRKEF